MASGFSNHPEIAIVGMASHFPDATTLVEFWNNIDQKKDSITENPGLEGYWKKEDFFDPDPSAVDKTYAYKAGWIPPIDFDPVEFKLPPFILDSISTAQLFALHVAKKALEDANLAYAEKCLVDRDRVGVILGGGGNGNTSFSLAARQQAPYLKEIMKNTGLPGYIAEDIIERLLNKYLEWNEDSFPGFLGNVACGRITSYFDFGGTSCMVDAACASSLAAIKAAIAELADGSCDAVLTGGVNLENSIFSFLCFSKTPALSKTNTSRPFDTKSDGMMLGDGVGMLVLKRLEDAERHGDKIYAVIKSISASSDGRAKSIFAPRSEGQIKALHRAYERAGLTPADIQLIEAHGTGTVSGDQTEVKSLLHVYGEHDIESNSIALGSVKSQIGHTRCAAGAASMIKVALGLHHKVLPPTINIEQPNQSLGLEDSPFYLNTESRPWIRRLEQGPRRGAISAFGFGGTNYHAVLEEYQHEHTEPYRLNQVAEVIVFHAQSPESLLTKSKEFLARFDSEKGPKALRDYLEDTTNRQIPHENARFAFVAATLSQTIELMKVAIGQLEAGNHQSWEHPLGIFYKPRTIATKGRIVALFPGQGSQYLNMARRVANEYPEMRATLENFDRVRQQHGEAPLSQIIYPNPVYTDSDRELQQTELTSTDNAQPAIGAVSLGYYKILGSMGFKADFVAGHSYGELTALFAAGVIDEDAFCNLSLARGRAMKIAPAGDADRGSMLAAAISEDSANKAVREFKNIIVANYNSDNQFVFGGATDTIEQLHKRFLEHGVQAQLLPVSAAFHTSFVSQAHAPFKDVLSGVNFESPAINVYSNYSGDKHHMEPEKLKDDFAAQLINPVYFKHLIERIYTEGGNCFVEIGPKGVLSKLVAEILQGKEHSVIALNPSTRGDESAQLRKAVAQLLVEGADLESVDPYLLRKPLEKPKGSLTYHMNGGFFFSDAGKERQTYADRFDTSKVDRFIDEQIKVRKPELSSELSEDAYGPASTNVVEEENTEQYPVYSPADKKHFEGSLFMSKTKDSTQAENTSLSAFNAQLQTQHMISEVHQQFQSNQKDYISFLNSLVNQQFNLLDKHHNSDQLKDMIGSLNQSFQLLDKNQQYYHINHERYFLNQQALLGATSANNGEAVIHSLPLDALSESAVPSVPSSQTPPPAPTAAAPQPEFNAARAMESLSAPSPTLPTMPESAAADIQAETTGETNTVATPQVDPEVLKQLESVTAEDLTKQLLTIISEKTGYPEDMIGLEMDLEADLGIDSIKRIEIIGAMFDNFSEEMQFDYDAEEYQDMETFDIEQFSTIQKMVDFLMETMAEIIEHVKNGGDSGGDTPPVAAQESASTNSRLDKTEISTEKTDEAVASVMKTIGFVTSSSDLEEDASFPKSEPAAVTSHVAESAGIQPKLVSKANVDSPRLLHDAKQEPAKDALGIQRYSVDLKYLPAADNKAFSLPRGHIWLLTDDGQGVSDDLLSKLQALGEKVVRLQLSEKSAKNKANNIAEYCLKDFEEATLVRCLEKIESKEGKVGGFIYLQPASANFKSIKTAFTKKDYDISRLIFMLAKHLQESLLESATKGSAYFYIISQLNGQLGVSQTGTFPLVSAGMSGLVKSLHHEWQGVKCRLVDIKAKLAKQKTLSIILEELADPQSDILEIGRTGEERYTLKIDLAEQAQVSETAGDAPVNASPLGDKDVLVVSGGARGITAQCVLALAKKYANGFILLGRTDIDSRPPEWSENHQSLPALKAAAIKSMQSSGQQPTPAKIDLMLKPILQAREVRDNIARIEAAGSRVVYVNIDITNRKELLTKVQNAEKQLGPVSGIIHAAGNLADKKINKKTIEDYNNVFSTKVKGLENLLFAVDPEKIKHLVLFSSVSGFFGNAGQTDYAMANEVLNKFAYQFKQHFKNATVKSINWGPWDSGMVNETLKKAYRDRGIAIIPNDIGAQYFVDEFTAGSELQVIVGSAEYQTPKPVKKVTGPVNIERNIVRADNPFLQDHMIDGNAVLPATCAVAWLVKVAEDILPGYRFGRLNGFKVLKGIVFNDLDTLACTVKVTPLAEDGEANSHQFEMEIYSGQQQKRISHYQAQITMVLQAADQVPQYSANLSDSANLKTALYRETGESGILFHGTSFSGIRKILNIDDHSITTECCLSKVAENVQGQFAVNSFNPYLADVFLQAPYAWLPLNSEYAGLPSAIETIEQYRPLDFDQVFYVSATVDSKSNTKLVASIHVHDENGGIYSRLSGVEFTVSKKLKDVLIDNIVEAVD